MFQEIINSPHKRSGNSEEDPEVVPESTTERAQRLWKRKEKQNKKEKIRKEKEAEERRKRGMILTSIGCFLFFGCKKAHNKLLPFRSRIFVVDWRFFREATQSVAPVTLFVR